MPHSSLSRYTPLLSDPSAFFKALEKPLAVALWTNSLKSSSMELERYLTSEELAWTASDWYTDAYRVEDWHKPGRSLPFRCGWCVIQEEIAWTAVQMLTPQPGDRVLDLCAAPGGKTAQLSLAVGTMGMVVANERSLPRLSSLLTTITRLGLTNVATCHSDGREFVALPHSFDRVLVDGPCSGEGTLRKKVGRHSLDQSNWNETQSHRLANVQQQLLDRALDLVKPGGIIVYSTCTFAPEENEAVIDRVLGDRGVIEPWSIPGLKTAPGICQWQGHVFRSDIVHTQRYWPHLNDTGGFFVARIRRTDQDIVRDDSENAGLAMHQSAMHQPAMDQSKNIRGSTAISGQASTLKRVDNRDAIDWMCDRFGLDIDLFADYQLWSTGQAKEWIANRACLPPDNQALETIGIPFVRHAPHGLKPTIAALQRFGQYITQQYVDLNSTQCSIYLSGKSQEIAAPLNHSSDKAVTYPQLVQHTSTPGFTHVRSGLYELGCGRLKTGKLYCELPKVLRSPHP